MKKQRKENNNRIKMERYCRENFEASLAACVSILMIHSDMDYYRAKDAILTETRRYFRNNRQDKILSVAIDKASKLGLYKKQNKPSDGHRYILNKMEKMYCNK